MHDLDPLGCKSDECASDAQTPNSLTKNCPTCGAGITAIVTRGPGDHNAAPCGQRVSDAILTDKRVATDGGLDPCSNCGEDPERGHRCQKCGKLEPNGSPNNSAGREAMQR